MTGSPRWIDVCPVGVLQPDCGVAALIDGQRQVALFRLAGDEVVAIHNHDPASHANVLARGIVGSVGDVVTVASPMYKQRFDLRTGRCVDDPEVAVDTFPVRVVGGMVQVGVE